MQQANAFDCGMFAAAFVFEWAFAVIRLLQSANLDVRYDHYNCEAPLYRVAQKSKLLTQYNSLLF